jgi:hypothetical protein
MTEISRVYEHFIGGGILLLAILTIARRLGRDR